MPLVAIRDLTEAQAQAWVAGTFSAECGKRCELKVWVEDNSCFAAVYVDGEPGEFFCGPDGDLSQTIRDDVVRQAVGRLIWDCDEGPGGSYVYAALVPGEDIPEFKRGECGCGYALFLEIYEGGPEWFFGNDHSRWPAPVGRRWYCPSCGSLLGPGGWALLAGRDPKDVQWPKEVSTEPDRAACTGATADSEDSGNP